MPSDPSDGPARRQLLKGALATATLSACTGATPSAQDPAPVGPSLSLQATAERPRNVVVIMTDDQRFDGFSFMGHPFLSTPNLDRLVSEGAWCAEAFVTTSLCCPSRASMLSGLYAHAHGVLNNQSELAASVPTYAQFLTHAGLDTAYIGKWHMGAKNPHPRPGWKRWIGFRGQGRYTYPGPDKLDPLDRGFSYDGTMQRKEGYVTDLLTDEAVTYLQSRQGHDTPFCLMVAHKACHAPFVPAPRHAEAFADAAAPDVPPDTDEVYAGLPDWLRRLRRNTVFGVDEPYGTWPDFTSWYRDYHRTLLAVDEGVGRILTAIQAAGLQERTVVLFVSDNGFMHGEKGVLDKRNAYETSIRIPLLAWAPGWIPAGLRIDPMVLNLDLAPTILELMGLHPPEHLHGRSLVPLLKGGTPKWRQDFLYEYFHERMFPTTPTVLAVRTATHKWITYRGTDTPPELYDLQADPAETTNLAEVPDSANRRKGLNNRLKRQAKRTGLLPDPVWGRTAPQRSALSEEE